MFTQKKKSVKKPMTRFTELIIILVIILIAAAVVVLCINFYVISAGGKYVTDDIVGTNVKISGAMAKELKAKEPQCILVLGAKVNNNGTPSFMLRDRLEVGIALYKKGVAPKLLLSGDNGQVEYDEVNVMKQYAIDKGVPKKDIFLDHAGFSTYDTMYRAKGVFKVERAVVVTQSYHLNRALYTGSKQNIKVWGIASDQRQYSGQTARNLREIPARNKDFFMNLFNIKPKYLGEAIPITGNGKKTFD